MIKITADSACDLTLEIIKKMKIELIPYCILVNNDKYRDGINIISADLFRYVEEENKICRTDVINIDEYEKAFAKHAQGFEAVIHIGLSSKLSESFQNAVIAAQKFNNVHVIDSCNLSTGSGYLVYDAALLAQQGASTAEICAKLQAEIPLLETSFIIDQLDYLYRGGRCSGLQNIGAKILQIKPCIEVIDGVMEVGKKYRGSLERCLEQYIQDRLGGREDLDRSRIFITHTLLYRKDILAQIVEIVKEKNIFDEVIVSNAGCTISCHCGPGTLGLAFKRK